MRPAAWAPARAAQEVTVRAPTLAGAEPSMKMLAATPAAAAVPPVELLPAKWLARVSGAAKPRVQPTPQARTQTTLLRA